MLVFITLPLTPFLFQAFHDMATHDVGDGSGGLDGSIAYELGRAEVRLSEYFLCQLNPDRLCTRILALVSPIPFPISKSTPTNMYRVRLPCLYVSAQVN